MANQAPVVIGVSSVDITVDDVLCAYIILADYFTDPSLPENVEQMLKYSLQGTTQGNGLTGGLPPVRFSM